MSAMAEPAAFSLRHTDAPIGTEIRGVDLSRDIDEATFDRIRQVLNERSVVFFRGQNLHPARQVAFTRRLGELKDTPLLGAYSLPDHPQVMRVSNIVENGKHIGNPDAGFFWHSDGAYQKRPAFYSLLYSVEIPARDGRTFGDTSFAATAAAYDALPEEKKRMLAPLRAIHSLSHQYEQKLSKGSLRREAMTEEERANVVPPVEHPLVRTHPLTGRKCLYVNEGHTCGIVGMEPSAAMTLLQELFAWTVRPEFVYRHRWQVGDFVIWDNIVTLHKASFDYELPLRRLMHRTTVEGGIPE